MPSQNFQEPFDHENPDSKLFDSLTFTAGGIHVGAFFAEPRDSGVYMDDSWFQRIAHHGYLDTDHIPDPQLQSAETIVHQNYFYYCYSRSRPAWPRVGDTRVSFYQVPSQVIGVVALQNSNGVPTSYTASHGNSFLLVLEQGDRKPCTMAYGATAPPGDMEM